MADIPSFAQPFVLVLLSLGAAAKHPGSDTANLTIFGQPQPIATAASFYAFTPTVRDARSESLKFKIENKPAWASFGKRRGTLYGTPTAADAGSYDNIIITVSDGQKTVQLRPFSINVTPQVTAVARR